MLVILFSGLELFWWLITARFGEMVKVSVPEMNWHGREAVYSVHFHPDGLLATGGMEPDGSGGIKLWKLGRDVAADVQPEYDQLIIPCYYPHLLVGI